MRFVSLYVVAVAVVWWGMAVPAAAQEEATEGQRTSEAAKSGERKEEGSGKGTEIVLDADLDEEFMPVELALQLAVSHEKDQGKDVDLDSVQALGLSVAETDRQKAYVHLRIAEMQYRRGDHDAAILSLRKGLPLADGDRSKDSLFFRILVTLLNVYDESGRINEARPYVEIYQEIVTAGVDPWERPSGTEDVIHKPSGIRLPHKLSIFSRTDLILFDDTGGNAGAAYKVEGGQFPEMTVYVVAGVTHPAKAYFDSAMRHILNRFKGAKVLSRGPLAAETEKGKVEGFAGRVNVPAKIDMGSDLYVFVREGTLIKFRVTFRARNREKIEGIMRDIFRSFDWP